MSDGMLASDWGALLFGGGKAPSLFEGVMEADGRVRVGPPPDELPEGELASDPLTACVCKSAGSPPAGARVLCLRSGTGKVYVISEV